ncbi:MAG: SRPBCC family protein [Nitrososphaerota archaeon]|jgi:uncharacterized protein YndB with AHSA1/START domain|nr:SRPBCC family protein [Nitrososphaerota archaeon]MDG6943162.1 SRPBCC family protein [Nitrososphaerota archaeon]MDG6950960.1 SRPBCC family protein [Nitrososphaerota archaeon]
MRFEASVLVKAPRERVYSAYIDFEAAPRWSKQEKVLSTSVTGKVVRVETTAGNSRKVVREVRLFPPERVESDGETRFTRTSSVVRFEGVPEGTKVTASLDLRFKGRWGWVLRTRGKTEVESSAFEELASFARYVEAL